MQIAIISDTHLPRGSRRLPAACVERLRAAELIIHAGDFVNLGVLEDIRRHGEVEAVHGNVDEPPLRQALPATRLIDCGSVQLAVVHNGGPRVGRLERLRTRFPGAAAVVFGHSHQPLHERAPDGFQIFNPGSPTDKRKAPHHTMGLARIGSSGVGFELIELD